MPAPPPTKAAVWLRLTACLAMSVALHAVLSAVRWERPEGVPATGVSPLVIVMSAEPPSAALPRSLPQPAPSTRRPVGKDRPRALARPAPPVPPLPAVMPPVPSEAADALSVAPVVTMEHGGDSPAESASDQGAAMISLLLSGSPSAGDGAATGLIKATPRYESNPLPPYPRLARQNRWEGTVRIRARVSAAGTVEGVTLERSSGHDVLDRAALDGVQLWKFIPATRGGIPVPSEVSIPVAFRLTK